MIPNITKPKVCKLGRGGIDNHFSVSFPSKAWSSFSTDVKPCAHCAAVNAQSTAGVGCFCTDRVTRSNCVQNGDVAAVTRGETLSGTGGSMPRRYICVLSRSRETRGLCMAVRWLLFCTCRHFFLHFRSLDVLILISTLMAGSGARYSMWTRNLKAS